MLLDCYVILKHTATVKVGRDADGNVAPFDACDLVQGIR
jgi:hypothetical protein